MIVATALATALWCGLAQAAYTGGDATIDAYLKAPDCSVKTSMLGRCGTVHGEDPEVYGECILAVKNTCKGGGKTTKWCPSLQAEIPAKDPCPDCPAGSSPKGDKDKEVCISTCDGKTVVKDGETAPTWDPWFQECKLDAGKCGAGMTEVNITGCDKKVCEITGTGIVAKAPFDGASWAALNAPRPPEGYPWWMFVVAAAVALLAGVGIGVVVKKNRGSGSSPHGGVGGGGGAKPTDQKADAPPTVLTPPPAQCAGLDGASEQRLADLEGKVTTLQQQFESIPETVGQTAERTVKTHLSDALATMASTFAANPQKPADERFMAAINKAAGL